MIPVNIPLLTEDDILSVNQALAQGWISGEGPVVQDFESTVATSVGRKYGVAVSNGSDALELAFEVLHLNPGDEVILPSFAIISCLAPLLRRGLRPVFIDVHSTTWNLQTDALQSSVTANTKAILVVHTYGLTVDMDAVLEVADKFDLWVIEDAAEAHGLKYKDRPCGSMGDISTFSFYANKNVTTGEGGMVLTDSERLSEQLKYLRNLTFRAERRFVHDDLGWNMRLSSLQAALGKSQLGRISQTVERRREIANAYIEQLQELEGVSFQAKSTSGGENGYWVVGIVLDGHPKFKTAEQAMKALSVAGVATRPFFFPLHQQPLLRSGYQWSAHGDLLISETLGKMGFYVPNGLGMTDAQLEAAVSITRGVLAS